MCRFYQEFGMCNFGNYCKFKHVENRRDSGNDKEIEEFRKLLEIKDQQIIAVAQKIETIFIYLESKDFFENDCEIEEKIQIHELDDDNEYEEITQF